MSTKCVYCTYRDVKYDIILVLITLFCTIYNSQVSKVIDFKNQVIGIQIEYKTLSKFFLQKLKNPKYTRRIAIFNLSYYCVYINSLIIFFIKYISNELITILFYIIIINIIHALRKLIFNKNYLNNTYLNSIIVSLSLPFEKCLTNYNLKYLPI